MKIKNVNIILFVMVFICSLMFVLPNVVYADSDLNYSTITLDPNGGTVESTSFTLRNGSYGEDTVYGELPTPYYKGYTFEGWQRKLPVKTILYGNYGVRISPSDGFWSGYSASRPYAQSTFKFGDIIFLDVTINNATITGIDCNDRAISAESYTISDDGHTIICKFVYGNEHYTYDYDFIDISVSGNPDIDVDEDVWVNRFFVYSTQVSEGARAYSFQDYTLFAKWGHAEHNYVFHSGYDATREADGKIDHYTCDCGKYFLKNGDVYEEVQAEEVTIPRIVDRYPLWITPEIRVTSANKDDILGNGTVVFNPETCTLTLNNASINYDRDVSTGWCINYRGTNDFTIVANGTNTLIDGDIRNYTSAGIIIGKLEKGYYPSNPPKFTLTINDNSSLVITCNDVNAYKYDSHDSYGIYNMSSNDMLINGGGALTIESGSERPGEIYDGFSTYGLYTGGNLTIENGLETTITSGDSGYYSIGLKADNLVVNKPNEDKPLTVNAGYGKYAYGIYTSGLIQNSGYTICIGNDTENSSCCAIYSYGNTINGGKVVAYSTNTIKTPRALYVSATLGEGITAIGNKTNIGKDGAEIYNKNDNYDYRYFEAGTGLAHTVTFKNTDKSDVLVIDGGKVERPESDPQKDNYDFEDWFTDENYNTKFDFENTLITKDTDIYAKFNVQYIFPDVPADKWYAPGIKYCKTYGLVNGYANGNFGPDDTLSRGQFVTILYRLTGGPETTGMTNPFLDVPDDKYYTEAVKWAVYYHITTGKTETSFDPDGFVTRQEMAVFLTRLYENYYHQDVTSTYDITGIADYNNVSSWAISSMKFIMEKGVITGDMALGYARILPRDSASRGAAATMLMRFSQNVMGIP